MTVEKDPNSDVYVVAKDFSRTMCAPTNGSRDRICVSKMTGWNI